MSDRKEDQDLDPPGDAAAVPLTRVQARPRLRLNLAKAGLFFISLYLFILGIAMMKDGAAALAPVLAGLSIENPLDSLGFGWLSAYLILSGSPVAASTLTFYNNGMLDQLSAFAMIIGSRMGAGFIVLFIGFLYVLRGRDRSTSLSMGLLSLIVSVAAFFNRTIRNLEIDLPDHAAAPTPESPSIATEPAE